MIDFPANPTTGQTFSISGVTYVFNGAAWTSLFVPSSQLDGMPVGCVIFKASLNIPPRYLLCDGALVSRSIYAELFADIGITYGPGDGSTTFKLPDARGEFLRGFDGGRGIDAGRSFGSLQLDAMQNHRHQTLFTQGNNGAGTSGVFATANAASFTTGPVENGQGAPRVAEETRPRNLALNVLIKF